MRQEKVSNIPVSHGNEGHFPLYKTLALGGTNGEKHVILLCFGGFTKLLRSAALSKAIISSSLKTTQQNELNCSVFRACSCCGFLGKFCLLMWIWTYWQISLFPLCKEEGNSECRYPFMWRKSFSWLEPRTQPPKNFFFTFVSHLTTTVALKLTKHFQRVKSHHSGQSNLWEIWAWILTLPWKLSGWSCASHRLSA